jgi:polar amino acid transport system substrate-binding protein
MSISRRRLVLTSAAIALAGRAVRAQTGVSGGTARASLSSASVVSAAEAAASLAPSGRLRVAINLGNTVLAQRNGQGELTGVSVILARALAERLKSPLDLVPFQAAGAVFDALDKDGWDLAFLAVEPERATKIDFSPPYVSIDGTYMVRSESKFHTTSDLDQPGIRIAAARGSAYDLYLTRALKHAELVRSPTSPASMDMFISDGLDAAAGVRQILADRARGNPSLRVLTDSFTSINQAIGVPRGRQAGAAYVKSFLEEMKASGKLRDALEASGQTGVTVVPTLDAAIK